MQFYFLISKAFVYIFILKIALLHKHTSNTKIQKEEINPFAYYSIKVRWFYKILDNSSWFSKYLNIFVSRNNIV